MVQRIDKQGLVLPQTQGVGPKSNTSFRTVLERVSTGLKVSAHAQERIRNRSIPFGPNERARVEDALQKAEAKGCRESLVMLDRNAFVVSVRNKTVVTAMDGMNVRDNVFTNIDSAVIA